MQGTEWVKVNMSKRWNLDLQDCAPLYMRGVH